MWLVNCSKTDSKTAPDYRKVPLPGLLADVFSRHRDRQLIEMSRVKQGDEWGDEDQGDSVVHSFVLTSARRPGRPMASSGDPQQWANTLDKAGLPHASPTRRGTLRRRG